VAEAIGRAPACIGSGRVVLLKPGKEIQ
jgi:hypothetical protein